MDKMNKTLLVTFSLLLSLVFTSPVLADDGYIPAYTASPGAVFATPPPTSEPKPTPTPTPTPVNSASLSGASPTPYQAQCKVTVKNNNAYAPADVTFSVTSTVNRKSVSNYSYDFGDGEAATGSSSITHHYGQAGTYTVTLKPIVPGIQMTNFCTTKVVLKAVPFVPHKSECSNLQIITNTSLIASQSATIRITGFDNKGNISAYRLQLNGQTYEQPSGDFVLTLPRPGSYTAIGWIKNTENQWVGGDGACQKTIGVKAAVIARQPETGPSSKYWFSLSLLFVIWVGALVWYRKEHPRTG